MSADILNIALGFLEGLALIISPCILPILPIILAGSLAGNKNRPLGIIFGFIIVFSLFTFFARALVQHTGVDTNLIRHFSYAILLLLGVMMLSTYLTDKFNLLTNRLMNIGSTSSTINDPQGGWMSGVLFGGLVAIVWTPCAGPILAAVIVQTVIQQSNVMSFLTLVAFGVGVAVPMLIITLFGRTLVDRFGYVKTHATLFRKFLGAIIILSVGYMIYFEGDVSATEASTPSTSDHLQSALAEPYPAPRIEGIDAWINSAPLQLNQLKGKVVLIDFWTYSCINCIRTLPYIKDWYQKYHNQGLVIIGIHTPEFEFEKNLNNVKHAVVKDGIEYPVALDNKFVTWLNFHNQYWPAHYLIDKSGQVVYTHFGEGEYDVTENNIRYLLNLKEAAHKTEPATENHSYYETPETYLGIARADHFRSPQDAVKDHAATYSYPNKLRQNDWALQGSWKIMTDRIVTNDKNAALKINFYARHVYMVMGNVSKKPITVKLLLDGHVLGNHSGKDVVNSSITVKQHSLYDVVALESNGNGMLEVTADGPGLEVYTFTFGG